MVVGQLGGINSPITSLSSGESQILVIITHLALNPSAQAANVFIVDDGLASGYTMLAAINFIKRKSPLKIIVAVPTASKKTVDSILPEVDELVCLNIRSGYPFAVADAYEDWYDLTDEEVLEILKKDNQNTKIRGTTK